MRISFALLRSLPGVLMITMSLLFSTTSSFAHTSDWMPVEEALQKGLPRTALERLEPILESALHRADYPEAARAITLKIALWSQIEGHHPEEKITRMEQEIEQAPAALRPVLQAVQAHWFWHFFQRNRWRFAQRTATAAPPSDDINTWDLPRIFSEIGTRFEAALAAAEHLQQIPIASYSDLLEPGTLPDRYRPTLYDFIAANALEFYTSGEQAGARPMDSFTLSADTPVFGALDDFLQWEPPTVDPSDPLYRAVRLYQSLLRFHRNAPQQEALLDWDLDRLRFAFNQATGEEKRTRYEAALRRFTRNHGDHEASARAFYEWARSRHAEEDRATAHALAREGHRRFPDSPGGQQCHRLVQEIEQPSSRVTAERVWNGTQPILTLQYRNLDEVHFRLISVDYVDRLTRLPDRPRPEHFLHEEISALLQRNPTRQWSAPLAPTPDFQERQMQWPMPGELKPGFYVLLTSHTADFRETENQVGLTALWVSELALIMRSESGSTTIEGMVLNAGSGAPIPEARIRVWTHRWNRDLQERASVYTDADGIFRISGEERLQYLLLAEHAEQQLSAMDGIGVQATRARPTSTVRVALFSDRAIYRPGQSIHFKGVVMQQEPEQDTYHVLPDRAITVQLLDVNGQRVEDLHLRTTDYGSFSGTFTAPRDRLAGAMTIQTTDPRGSARVRVEEYKRPTFEVQLDAPEIAPKLHEIVEISGTATAYTGAAADGAGVQWRVTRQTQRPIWRHGWGAPPESHDQEMARGTALTDGDGRFQLAFTARPDPTVAEADQPVFHYAVHVDVTDPAGETRSTRRIVRIGYTALQLALDPPHWIQADAPFSLRLRATSLDGVGQPATGHVQIHELTPPDRVHPASLADSAPPIFPRPTHLGDPWGESSRPDGQENPAHWAPGRVVHAYRFEADPGGHAAFDVALPPGAYRFVATSEDRHGKAVRVEHTALVVDEHATTWPVRMPYWCDAPKWSVEPGETFTAVWGSGYDDARAYVEIEHRGERIQHYWTTPGHTQIRVEQDITESMRGGFTLRVLMVQENRAYIKEQHVQVPWSNKQLQIQWERFVSRLEPGAEETWTAIIQGPDAERAVAEMVATLYDASLDAFVAHTWPRHIGGFRHDHSRRRTVFQNVVRSARAVHGNWPIDPMPVWTYRSFRQEVLGHFWGHHAGRTRGMVQSPMAFSEGAPMMVADAMAMNGAETMTANEKAESPPPAPPTEAALPPTLDLDLVQARTHFEETAFFLPHLMADDDGIIRMSFTMPEAVTRWKFMGFAHDRELRSGLLTDELVTAKDLMVRPNPPRFLREGDELEFTVRVLNQSPARQTGTVRLTFADARTHTSQNAALGHTAPEQAFDIPSGESRTYRWRIAVPDGMGVLTYRAVAATTRLSDGEEAFLPVLSRRVFVTESLPLPIRGPDTRTFRFEKLLAAGASDTLQHKGLTVQMVSNPAWYAVLALPYLMEFPHVGSEQIFNRFYANALARFIAGSDPRMRHLFDQWRGTDALDSPLEKNEDLKSVLLEETPWVRQAQRESQARRQVGILFDANRLNDESARAQRQLAEQQLASGAWPWFPGGPPNEFITLYIATGYGRLRHLGITVDVEPARRAWRYLDEQLHRRWREQQPSGPDDSALSPYSALYLYGRSFFIEEQPLADAHRPAWEDYVRHARAHGLKLPHRLSQAQLAVALHRLHHREDAQRIMRSIRERAVEEEELGMFWRDTERSWWWYRAPIEAQAMMIEAFDEVLQDAESVEACRVWLLKQKQTQHWRSTKATADAVYALLLRGVDWLHSSQLVSVTLGDRAIEPEHVEAGTGFYEVRIPVDAIQPEYGRVTVQKLDSGVAWGSVHWQYLETIERITAHTATPLQLEKTVYRRAHTARGPELQPLDTPAHVGDELVVRIVLRTDRDMEYVHLKDHRPSGTEPVNVLSRYRYQDGLAYYESTRDTASHFFIDYLPKGVYVFEYALRVQHRGRYQTGRATLQCLYAPEFNSHSASLPLQVD